MSEPLRTCIGCRLRDNPRNMLRIVRFGGDGERMRILPDVHRTLPGRGAYGFDRILRSAQARNYGL